MLFFARQRLYTRLEKALPVPADARRWTVQTWLILNLFVARADEPALASPPRGAETRHTLRMIEDRLASMRTVQTAFRQEKKLAILNHPLVLEGMLYLELPDRLAWHVTSPTRYRLVLNGARVRQWDEDSGEVQSHSAAQTAILRAVCEQLKSWFAGRLSQLAKDYDITVVGSEPFVIVRLVPKPGSPAAVGVRVIRLTLRKDMRYVHALDIEETGGDSTRIEFHNTVLDEPIPPTAWEVKPRD